MSRFWVIASSIVIQFANISTRDSLQSAKLKLIDFTQPLRPLLVHCLDKIFTLFSLQLLNLVVFNTSCWHRASYIYWTKRISESQHICRLLDLGQHQFYKYWLPLTTPFFWPLWMHHIYNLLIDWHIHSK